MTLCTAHLLTEDTRFDRLIGNSDAPSLPPSLPPPIAPNVNGCGFGQRFSPHAQRRWRQVNWGRDSRRGGGREVLFGAAASGSVPRRYLPPTAPPAVLEP